MGNSTYPMERYIPVAETRSNPPRLVIVLASRIQKSGTGDNNFVKWKRTLRSDRQKWPDWSKRTTFKLGLEYSGRTKPKWSVPFDVPAEISEILGWMESSDARSRIHFKILLPRDLLEKGIFKGIRLRKIYARHYRVCFYQSYHFKIPYTKHEKGKVNMILFLFYHNGEWIHFITWSSEFFFFFLSHKISTYWLSSFRPL